MTKQDATKMGTIKYPIYFTGVLVIASTLFTFCTSSDKENSEALFEKIDSDKSGISFVNVVPESDSLSQFTWFSLPDSL